MFKRFFIFLVIILNSHVGAHKDVNRVIEEYKKQTSVIMYFKKTLTQTFLNKKIHSRGEFFLAQNLWRLNILSPQKSSLIFDGKSLLFYKLQSNAKYQIPLSKSPILSIFLNPKLFNKNFKYKNLNLKGRTSVYSYDGISQEFPKKLLIQIEKDRILSIEAVWEDPLGSEYYRFSSIIFGQKIDKKIFEHQHLKE